MAGFRSTLYGQGNSSLLLMPGQWRRVTKPVATDRTSTTTLTDDPDLAFTIPLAGRYFIRGSLFEGLGSQTGGISWQFAFSGTSSTNLSYRNNYATNGNVAGTDNDSTLSALVLPSGTGTGNTWPNLHTDVEIVLNATSAGIFSFQWAQAVSNVNPTQVRAGSYLEWSRFP